MNLAPETRVGRVARSVAALLIFAPVALLTGCSSPDEPISFGGGGSGSFRREYAAGDSRVVEASYFSVGDARDNDRRRYVAVVVCDFTELDKAGYLLSSGGGCSMSARRVACEFSREFYREYGVNHRKLPCHVAAWDWDSYYFNNTRYEDSAGRLFLWKIAADGTGTFSGPYVIAGGVTDSGKEVWDALDAAFPKYAPGK